MCQYGTPGNDVTVNKMEQNVNEACNSRDDEIPRLGKWYVLGDSEVQEIDPNSAVRLGSGDVKT